MLGLACCTATIHTNTASAIESKMLEEFAGPYIAGKQLDAPIMVPLNVDGAIAAASMVSILLALSVVLVLERLIGLKAYVKL